MAIDTNMVCSSRQEMMLQMGGVICNILKLFFQSILFNFQVMFCINEFQFTMCDPLIFSVKYL